MPSSPGPASSAPTTAVPSKRGRLKSLDALRGIAVFLMIEQHMGVWLWHGPEPGRNLLDYPALLAFNALGGGAAPLFVTLAGAGSALLVATGRPGLDRTLVARGLVLIGFGVLLNLLTPSWFSWGSWFVLHMMGFAIALAPLWRRLSTPTLILTSIGVLAATVLVQDALNTPIRLDNERMRDTSLPGGPLRLALAEGQFPILPWLVFYLAGFVSGRWIARNELRRVGVLGLSVLGLALVLVAIGQSGIDFIHYPLLFRLFELHLGFFPASPTIATLLLSIPLLAMWGGLRLEQKHPLASTNPVVTLGRASLTLLMVHVVLFRELTRPVDLWQNLSADMTLLAIFGFVVLSTGLSRAWSRVEYVGGAEWMLRKLAR